MSSVRGVFLSRQKQIWGCNMALFQFNDYIYNLEDPKKGLFWGQFLVCVSILLFYCHTLTPMPSIGPHQYSFWHECCGYKKCQKKSEGPAPLYQEDVQAHDHFTTEHCICGSSGE